MWVNLILVSALVQQPSTGTVSLSARVVDAIDHNYLFADGTAWKHVRYDLLDDSNATIPAMDQLLAPLRDGDLRIMTSWQMAAMQSETAGKELGIGLVDFAVTVNPHTGDAEVVTPLLGSPAFRAGLRPGDVIESVNGKSTHGLSHEDLMALLRGDSGTLSITVRRGERHLLIQVPKAVWTEQAVIARGFEADNRHLGYIGIRLFTPDSGDLVRRAVAGLASRGVHGYIVDLRNNPGGYLDAMALAGSAFTDKILGWKVRRDGTREPIHSAAKRLAEARVVVLVNAGTASAAEILAAGLHDTLRASLVGTRTFGRGQIQTYISIGNDAGVIIPEANAQSAKGVRFNKGSGLEPDISIPSSTGQQAGDAAYEKAVQLLTHG